MTVKPDNPTQTNVHRWTQDQISGYIDDSLTQPEKARVESHLTECAQCAQDFQTLCQTVEWLRQMPIQPLPRSFMIPESEAPTAGFSLDWLFPYFRAGAVAAALLLVFVLSADLFQTSFSTARLARGPAYREKIVRATSVTTHEPAVPPAKGTGKSDMSNVPAEMTDTPPGKTEGVFPSLGLIASAPPSEPEMLDKAVEEGNLAERKDGQMAYEQRPADELPPPSLDDELFQEESKTGRETEIDTDMASALLLQEGADQAFAGTAPQAVEEAEEPVGEQLIAPPPLAASPVLVERAAPAAPVPQSLPEEPPSGNTTRSIAPSATPLATFVPVTPTSDIMSPPAPTGEVAWVQSTSPPVSTPPPRMREEHTVTLRQTSHRLLWRVIEVSLLLIFLVSVTGAWLLTRQRSGSKI
jgi:hypothetical protein